MGLTLIKVVAGDVDHAGFVVESIVDPARGVGRWIQTLLNIEQQDLVELCHGLGRPVVALHQLFAGANHSFGRGGG